MKVSALSILAIHAAVGPLSNAAPVAARCCTLLKLAHQNETFMPNTTGYQSSTNSYWSLQARTQPSCIITPFSAQQVSAITQIFVKNGCLFAIRSGGHNPFPDNNIDSPGVTIDLSKMNSVLLGPSSNSNGSVASVGPGARWQDVYNYLGPKGYAVGGGRAADVGVGGLTLGGGNSFFAARFGFVCDNVENFQVVLASGQLVNANNTNLPDLWQVLKGGSNNFGIVTRIDLTVFEAGDIWGGVVVYPASTIPAQINAFVNFTNKIVDDPFGSLISIFSYSSATNTTVIQNCYQYTTPISNAPIFHELLSIKPQIPKSNTLRIANLTSLTKELEAPDGLRDLFATLSFANDAAVIAAIYQTSQKLLEPLKNVKGLIWDIMFQPLPSIISQHSVSRGGNIMGLDRANGNQVLFLFLAGWTDESDDNAMMTAASNMMKQVKALTVEKGKANDWIYLNYALQSQNPLGSYGKRNLDKIRAASRKYDPNGVFQKLVPGGYKIANAQAHDE